MERSLRGLRSEKVCQLFLDNSVAEAFFSGLQRELLDQHTWNTRDQLATALFDWIETWYNPRRRHSYNDGFSPIDYETAHAA